MRKIKTSRFMLPLIIILLISISYLIEVLKQEPQLQPNTWRSAMFPENWVPVDEQVIEGVNVFYDSLGTLDENNRPLSENDPRYHPYRFLHDFSYAGYHYSNEPIPPLNNNDWTDSADIFDVTKSPYSCIADGQYDCTNPIQNAINDAGNANGGIVYLPQGEYRIKSTSNKNYFLIFNKNKVVLRGAGKDKTRIKVDPFVGSTPNMYQKQVFLINGSSSWYPWEDKTSSEVSIIKDIPFPAKVIPIRDISIFRVGDPIIIRGDRNDAFLTRHDMNGIWPASRAGYYFRRTIADIDIINKTITIDVPTRYEIYTVDNPVVVKTFPSINEIGIENLSIGEIRHPDEWAWTGDITVAKDTKNPPIIYQLWKTTIFKFSNAENCWIYNVDSYRPGENIGKYPINKKFGDYEIEILNEIAWFSNSRQITLKDMYFKKAQVDAGSANGYAIRLEGSDNLFDNVKIEMFKKGFAAAFSWSNGNVFKDCTTNNPFSVSDLFHWELSMSNLVDNHVFNGSYWKTIMDGLSDNNHGHTSSQSVFWNVKGLRKPDVSTTSWFDRDNDRDNISDALEPHKDILDEALIISHQYGWGYIIGSSGVYSKVITPLTQRQYLGSWYRPYTLPEDYKEGISYDKLGWGELEPRSLFDAQLEKRLNLHPLEPIICEDSDKDGFNVTGKSCGPVDCNDALFEVNPLKLEICEDSLDNDCNGLTDSQDSPCKIDIIIDNTDSGFSSKPKWGVSGATGFYGLDSVYSNNLNANATWEFTEAKPGEYEVYAWWTYWNSRSIDAPYTIYNKELLIKTIRVNQRDIALSGKWNYLGTFNFSIIPKITITVEKSNGDSYNADAIKISKIGPLKCNENINCFDNNPCTIDSCVNNLCQNDNAADRTSCEDSLYCNGQEICIIGKCEPGQIIDCSDYSGDCKLGICNESLRSCESANKEEGVYCDDELTCTDNDICRQGSCSGEPVNIDDSLSCTQDACSEDKGIVHLPQDSYCNDNTFCNGIEYCDAALGCINGITQCVNELETCDENLGKCSQCELINASWSRLSAIEDETISLILEGKNCNGKTAEFKILEDDILGGEYLVDDPVNSNPNNAAFSNNLAIGTWKVEYLEDIIGDPEYYFIAKVGENIPISISNKDYAGLLRVSRKPGICKDEDHDGYNQSLNGCGQIFDCDDSSNLINPTKKEICGDNLDNNCDTKTDREDDFSCPKPSIRITYPSEGQIIKSNRLNVSYNLTGDLSYFSSVTLQLDSLPVVFDTANNRLFDIANISVGNHRIKLILIEKDSNGLIENSLNFTADYSENGLPMIQLYEPIDKKEYINSLVPLKFKVTGLFNCSYILDNTKVESDCSTSTLLKIIPKEKNIKENHTIFILAKNNTGEFTVNANFIVKFNRSIIIQYDEFSSNPETTRLASYSDNELMNINLHISNEEFGIINWILPVNLTSNINKSTNITNLDEIVNISFNKIEVKKDIAEFLNKKAKLTLKKLSFNNPKILEDGLLCNDCLIESYNNGNLVFNVTGFSVYSAEETLAPPPNPPSGPGSGGPGPDIPPVKPDNRINNTNRSTNHTAGIKKITLRENNIDFLVINQSEKILIDYYGTIYESAMSIINNQVSFSLNKVNYLLNTKEVKSILIGNRGLYIGLYAVEYNRAVLIIGLNQDLVENAINPPGSNTPATGNNYLIYYIIISVSILVILLIIFIIWIIKKQNRNSIKTEENQ